MSIVKFKEASDELVKNLIGLEADVRRRICDVRPDTLEPICKTGSRCDEIKAHKYRNTLDSTQLQQKFAARVHEKRLTKMLIDAKHLRFLKQENQNLGKDVDGEFLGSSVIAVIRL